MDSSFVILFICGMTAVTYLLFGFLIGYGQKANLINGVDFLQITSVQEFCKYFGKGLIVSGILLVSTGAIFYSNNDLVLFTVLFFMFCCLPFVYFVRAKKRYSKDMS